MHVPLQPSIPAWQGGPHAPPLQTKGDVHATVHIPQLATSLWTSTHVPLHSTSGMAHGDTQVPSTQWFCGQMFPHSLQFSGSLEVSTHSPSHTVLGGSQLSAPPPWPLPDVSTLVAQAA